MQNTNQRVAWVVNRPQRQSEMSVGDYYRSMGAVYGCGCGCGGDSWAASDNRMSLVEWYEWRDSQWQDEDE